MANGKISDPPHDTHVEFPTLPLSILYGPATIIKWEVN